MSSRQEAVEGHRTAPLDSSIHPISFDDVSPQLASLPEPWNYARNAQDDKPLQSGVAGIVVGALLLLLTGGLTIVVLLAR